MKCSHGNEWLDPNTPWPGGSNPYCKPCWRAAGGTTAADKPTGRPLCINLAPPDKAKRIGLRVWRECLAGFGSVTGDERAGHCCGCHSPGRGVWRIGIECGTGCPGFSTQTKTLPTESPGGKYVSHQAALPSPQEIPWRPWAGESEIKWAYGVTTVPSRRNTNLPISLRSLVNAGFPNPHLFIDGDDDGKSWREQFGLTVTARGVRTRAYGNWITALWELYTRNPTATRFAMFQDDIIAAKGIRPFLDASSVPEDGYLNLFVHKRNYIVTGGVKGWRKTDQRGRGALGLVFSRPVVQRLLSSQHLIDRVMDPKRGHRSIDGGISDAMVKLKFTEWVFNPSLLMHTGDTSAIGNREHPQTPNFIGEGSAPLDLLKLGTAG